MRYLFWLPVILLQGVVCYAQSLDYIFTGSGIPQDQGWIVSSGTGHLGGNIIITPQSGGGLSDIFSAETTVSQFHLYEYATGNPYSEFLLTARVRIDSAQHNALDGGFYLSPFGFPNWGPERYEGLYLLPDRVGFMDDTSSAPVAAGQFHEYAFYLKGGRISVFVDDPAENILAGTATPELSRLTSLYSQGWVLFGDQTNDEGVNSKYAVDDVKFVGITVYTPEPGSASLVLFGALALISKRKRSVARRNA